MSKPTEEQQVIIDAVANGKTLKVAALAGTGKTSTLVMIAKAYPNRKGLYLAYNKALQKEAVQKFPKWIHCKTIHGLAFEKTGFQFFKQLSLRPDYAFLIEWLNLNPITLEVSQLLNEDKKPFNLEISPSKQLEISRELIRYFTFSDDDELNRKSLIKLIEKEIIEKQMKAQNILKDTEESQQVLKVLLEELPNPFFELSTRVWDLQKSCQSEIVPADHDTYLKLYQLTKPSIENYDYIMLDEAQDANPCILDILSYQKKQVIYVGDENQQIYGYRGTINAMQRIDAKTLYLTQSFRFGKVIAEKANEILKELKSPVTLKGMPSIPSKLKTLSKPPYTFLARTNAALFEKCAEGILDGYQCCLLGDVHGILSLYKSAFSLWSKKPEWVKDERLRPFQTWKALLDFAQAEEDTDLLGAVSFIRNHQGESLNLLKIIEQSKNVYESKADIILSTVHKAKGREWNQVMLADDFSLKSREEMNIYYVAITRAKLSLEFPIIVVEPDDE